MYYYLLSAISNFVLFCNTFLFIYFCVLLFRNAYTTSKSDVA